MADTQSVYDPSPGLELMAAILDEDNGRIRELTGPDTDRETMIQALASLALMLGVRCYGDTAAFRQVVAEQLLDLDLDPLTDPLTEED